MIKILIWDNDSQFLEVVRKCVKYAVYEDRKNVELLLQERDEEKLINIAMANKKGGDINLYMLKVDECDISHTVEVIKKIREYDPLGYITLVGEDKKIPDEFFDFSLKITEYFAKPMGEDVIRNLIKSVETDYEILVKQITMKPRKIVAFTHLYQTRLIDLNDIIAVEYRKPRTIIHTMKGELIVYKAVKNVLNDLKEVDDEGKIIQVHSGYIINLDNVKNIDFAMSLIVMKKGITVPISRSNKNKVKEIVNENGDDKNPTKK